MTKVKKTKLQIKKSVLLRPIYVIIFLLNCRAAVRGYPKNKKRVVSSLK